MILALTALVALTAGAVTTANAVEFAVGPGGVYVGPDRYERHFGEGYYGPHFGEGYYGGCRTVIEHALARWGLGQKMVPPT
jgi:hypothetical protein